MPLASHWRRHCCVPFCGRSAEKDGIRLFCLPRNPQRLEDWLIRLNNPMFRFQNTRTVHTNYRICSIHFPDNAFRTPEKLRLNSNAVPSIFPDAPTGSSTTNSNEKPQGNNNSKAGASTSSISFTLQEAEQTNNSFDSSVDHGERAAFGRRESPVELSRKLRKSRLLTKIQEYIQRMLRLEDVEVPRPVLLEIFKGLSTNKKYIREMSEFLRSLPSAAVKLIVTLLRRGNRVSRWTMSEKAVCLSIYQTSRRCYRFLAHLVRLPLLRTLGRCTRHIELKPGINDELFRHLATKSKTMRPLGRYCVLMFDEMVLQPTVSMSKQWNSVVGLEDFGSGWSKNVADRALVFMIRGINDVWKQPICYFFMKSPTKPSVLKSLIKEVIKYVHKKTKLVVLATVCSQRASYQAAVTELSLESGYSDDLVFKIIDLVDGRSVEYTVFHLFDPPHLLKCLRDRFMQNDIYFRDTFATFRDLEAFFAMDGVYPDARLCPRLTARHIRPFGRHKLRVRLASQLLSRSVYAGMSAAARCGLLSCSRGTAEFVLFVNKLFDTFNGIRFSSKPLRRPVRDGSAHYEFWSAAESFLDGLVFRQNGTVVEPPPSVRGFLTTIRNVRALRRRMRILGSKFLLTSTLNQDPLENFFGVIRGLCGQNYEPTCSQFVAAFKTCLIANLTSSRRFTNCKEDGADFLILLRDPSTCSSSVARFPQNPSDISKIISTMRLQTSSYIAGFMYAQFMILDCDTCNRYFVTNICTDNHSSINFQKFGQRSVFPSGEFIAAVEKLRLIILKAFVSDIDSSNIYEDVLSRLPKIFSVCPFHDSYHNDVVNRSLTVITFKYCCELISKKLCFSDQRSHRVIDDYLLRYGSWTRKT